MKKFLTLFISFLCIAGVAGFALYNNYLSKDYYNDGYVNGNTAGNLYNSGLFCEYDNVIYFANPNDGMQLYRMNPDGSEIEKISDDSAAFINADENYIYYARSGDNSESYFSFLNVYTHSLCRLRRDGRGEVVVLDTDPCMYASLVGNYIYYIHYNTTEASSLYSIKNDGEEKRQVFPQTYFTCCTDGQYIYYNGLENDHNVYRLDTATLAQTLVYEGNCWMPIVEDNYVYFMDCDNSYSLARADLTTGEKITLVNEWVDCFNVHNGVIYFQRNSSEPAFCSVNTDGSDYTVLKNGIYTKIHVAGDLVFFKDFTTEQFYKMSIRDGWISPFDPPVAEE